MRGIRIGIAALPNGRQQVLTLCIGVKHNGCCVPPCNVTFRSSSARPPPQLSTIWRPTLLWWHVIWHGPYLCSVGTEQHWWNRHTLVSFDATDWHNRQWEAMSVTYCILIVVILSDMRDIFYRLQVTFYCKFLLVCYSEFLIALFCIINQNMHQIYTNWCKVKANTMLNRLTCWLYKNILYCGHRPLGRRKDCLWQFMILMAFFY